MGFFDFFENQYHVVLQGDLGNLKIELQEYSPLTYSIFMSGEKSMIFTSLVEIDITQDKYKTKQHRSLQPLNGQTDICI